MIERITAFFSGWRFPVLALTVLGGCVLVIGALVAWPPAPTGIGAMAEVFRVRCFTVDAQTGHLGWASVAATFGELVMLMLIIGWFWAEPLASLRKRPVRALPQVASGAIIVTLLSLGLSQLDRPALPVDPNVFPADGLRTAIPAPDFTLTDQDGHEVSRKALQGRVVLVTGVYASCGLACPRILAQAKHAVAALSEAERLEVTVLGVTLDPEHDDVARLEQMARAQKIATPQFHLLTGSPPTVNHVLDTFDVTRRRDPATGLIDHANVFVLIDRTGAIAYRFGLGEQQEQWLISGLRVLLHERERTAMQE